jgi:hypothetical protein
MISTHGTWNTTDETKADLLREYYDTACEAVEQKLESLEKPTNKDFKEAIQLYLGYDGDGVQSEGLVPPTLLLLMLISRFAEYDPIIIQSQGLNSHYHRYYNPQPFTDINNRMDDKGTNLKPYEKAFVDQLNLKNVNEVLSQKQNITLAYKEAENNDLHWNYELLNYYVGKNEQPLDLTEELKNFELKDKLYDPKELDNIKKFINYKKYHNNSDFNGYISIDLPKTEGVKQQKYGGYEGRTLVGSTAAWQKYFDENPNLFDHVYYLPVWNDYFTQIKEQTKDTNEITEIQHNLWDTPEEKPEKTEKPEKRIQYKESKNVKVIISGNPVTKLIQEACNKNIFRNNGTEIEVIEGCVKKLIVEKISNVQRLIKQFNNTQSGGRRTKKGENKKSKKVNRKNTRKTQKNKRKSTKKRMYKRK